MTDAKGKSGRPSKIVKLTEACEKIMNQHELAGKGLGSVIIYTDKELMELVNEQLDKEDRIGMTAFGDWKNNPREGDERFERFSSVYKKALHTQKMNLFERYGKEKYQWTKWAWVLERKFSEWNKVDKKWHGEDKEAPLTTLADFVKSVVEK